MPLYEYECDDHGHRFEVIQKFSDPPVEVCPKCGGKVHKLISSPAFQFKGSGWYVTDYAKKDSGGGRTGGESGEKSDKTEKKDVSAPDKDSSATKKDDTTSSSSTEKANS